MSPISQLLLVLAIIVVASKLAGAAAGRIGQPPVFGEILVGLLLGPTLLDLLHWFPAHGGHPTFLADTVHALSEVGVVLLMFLAGLETDLPGVRKVGYAAFLAASGGVVLPLVLGAAAAYLYSGYGIYAAIFVGTILTATSVSISAQTLLEMGKLRTQEGGTILGAAVIDDVIGIIVLSLVIAFKPETAGATAVPESLVDWVMTVAAPHLGTGAAPGTCRVVLLVLLMAAFFYGFIRLGFRWMQPLLARSDRIGVSRDTTAIALALAFVAAVAAEWIGSVAAITGSYMAGLAMGSTTYKERLEQKFKTLCYAFFVPCFLVGIGLRADARPLVMPLFGQGDMHFFWSTLLIIFIAITAKIAGCWAGARLAGFPNLASWRVGVGMISRGEVGLIVASVGLRAQVIDQQAFSAMVIMVLATTLVTPPLLKLAFRHAPHKSGRRPAAHTPD